MRFLFLFYLFAFAAVLCCVWATEISKATRDTTEMRCARRKSHKTNWRRNNEAAATNRTAQESKTEWKQKMFYFSNLFLAVAPCRAALRESRTGRLRARESERVAHRESTVAAKVATKRLLAHTHTHARTRIREDERTRIQFVVIPVLHRLYVSW